MKKKGGWPKGRKRKPESENRPPKAPSTGYVFYLNEKRKLPIFKDVPFHEVSSVHLLEVIIIQCNLLF